MSTATGSFEIPVGFHQGKVMVKLAKNYANLVAVIDEVVQNGIDAGADRLRIEVNLKRGHLHVYDNGTGASREKIGKALDSIGDTMKAKDKFGKFGLGLIAPLSIADDFTLTTCPDARLGSYSAYEFVTREIAEQKSVNIPGKTVDLAYEPDGKVWWRTEVHARGLTKDLRKTSVTAEEIAESVSLKFGEAILERGIKITVEFTDRDSTQTTVKVQPREFTGEPLPKFSSARKECGKVEATLFVARRERKGRKGEITFGTLDNPSRLTVRQFAACAANLLEGTIAKALLSGVLEGIVLCEKVTLHEDRTRFEDDDALFAFCETLEEWYRKVGKETLQQTAETDADDRFQRIGTEVMPFAELLLKQDQFKQVASRINIGTIGTGHARVPKKIIIGKDAGTAVSTDGNPFGDRGEGGGNGAGGKPGKTELPTHRPGIIYGNKGSRRTEVKGSSTGLRFEFVDFQPELFRVPFEFDPESGTLSFNRCNQNWGLCQENDGFMRQYYVAVVTAALALETFRDPANSQLSEEVRRFSFESLNHHVFAIMNSEAMTAEVPKGKPRK